MLKTNYNIGQYWLEVCIQDLNQYNENLGAKIKEKPNDYLPIVSLFNLIFNFQFDPIFIQ